MSKIARSGLVSCWAWVSLLALPALAGAAPADLDLSFGGDGIVSVEGAAGDRFAPEAAARMAIGPGDDIFVLYSTPAPCSFPFSECTVDLALARYDAEGRRDASFGAGPGSQLTVRQFSLQHAFDLAVGPDGKPVVAAFDGATGVVVARFDRQGRLDSAFGGAGRAPQALFAANGAEPAVAVQGDGKVVVAAEGFREGDRSRLHLARYLTNGERDAGFGSGGEATATMPTRSRPAGIMLGRDGSISVAAPQCCGGQALFGNGVSFLRFLSNGAPDPGLDGDGLLLFPAPEAQGTVQAAALAPGGGLLAVLEEEFFGDRATVGNLVKLRPDGALDRGFGGDGRVDLIGRVGPVDPFDIVLDGQGRLVGVGWLGSVMLFRLRPDGGTDRTFNGGERIEVAVGGEQEAPIAVGLQSKGRIVALGGSSCCGPRTFALLRLRGGTDRSRCLGKRATVVGTRGPDELTGTPRRDVIVALAGKDTVRGLSGPDLICGGKGRDKLLGGTGRDRVQEQPRESPTVR